MTYTYLSDGTKVKAKIDKGFGSGLSGIDLAKIDFGARFYDPYTARWTTIDPLASKYSSISPYTYCANDPVNKFDPDGRDFTVKERRNIIRIEASIYTNKDDEIIRSANQAASFWNNRNSDSYNGKKIQYKITVISIKNADFDIKQNGVLQVKVNPSENKYDVNNQKLLETTRNPKATGCLDSNTGNIYVRNDCSFYTPNSTNPSTTGAHEIGHMLGMSHKDEGIMTEKLNDPKRNNDVLQSNINEMMQSSFGHHDIISKIVSLYDNYLKN